MLKTFKMLPADPVYRSADGTTIVREFDGVDPYGNPMAGRWVMRNRDGDLIDYDQYLNDMAARRSLDLNGNEYNWQRKEQL